MCGITGIYGIRDQELINEMNELIKHRGPDGSGSLIKDNISLGHVRLSIIDLSEKGAQPMCNENETIWITFNGEIYNYKELKESLSNHTFKSLTDTETILHLYEEKGLNFVTHLRGMFAFALWDSKKDRLMLCRDPIGKKPLYYYQDGRKVVFCSEIKGILCYFKKFGIKIKEDEKSVELYKAYQYVPNESTMFKGIKKVLPGSVVLFHGGKKRAYKYWDLQENIVKDNSIEHLDKLLEESVKIRMLASDVPIGCFLSGGLDSSMVLALAKKYVNYKIHTFTLGFENFSEFAYAKQVSDYLGTEHHEILLKGEDVAKEIKKIVWHFDEPPGDAAIVNNYFLSREARKYVKVVLADRKSVV
jgi:asparagine synthase (glutamine-hydrolysing)